MPAPLAHGKGKSMPNALLLAASFSLLSDFAAAQAQVHVGPDGRGCGPDGLAVLNDGSTAAATITFAYTPHDGELRVTVANTTPTAPGLPAPTITSIFFNTPEATVTTAALLGQTGVGKKAPRFQLTFDANAHDAQNPNLADCFGTFNFRLAVASARDGIAAASATVCGAPAATPVTGPVTFVLRLDGPEVHNLSADVFTASTSRNTGRKVNVAVAFDGGTCAGSGILGNGDICRVAVFSRGSHEIGQNMTLSVVGGEQCRAFLGVSPTPGPVDLGVVVIPVGLPLLFSYDLGYLPLGVPEANLQVFVPHAPELIGFTGYMTALTHPYQQELFGQFGFAPAYAFTIGNGMSYCPPSLNY